MFSDEKSEIQQNINLLLFFLNYYLPCWTILPRTMGGIFLLTSFEPMAESAHTKH
jgi:hypothetical protein